MKTIQYFDILKRALLMTWKHKLLWFFGFIIFLGSIPAGMNTRTTAMPEKSVQAQVILNFMSNHPYVLIALIVGVAILWVLIFALRTLAVAGVIKSINNIAVYSQSSIVNIIKEVKKYFWSLLLLEIMINIALSVVAVLLFVPVAYLFVLNIEWLYVVFLLIAVVIFLALLILAQYLRKYAYFFIVLGNMPLRIALDNAYNLFNKNFKESLLMGLVAISLNISILVVVFVVMLLLAVVAAPFAVMFYLLLAKTGVIIVLTISVLIAIIILFAIFAWYAAFVYAVWTLFFQEISYKKKETSTVEELSAQVEMASPEAV